MEKLKEKIDYCMNCKLKPCKSGCPLENDIPEFILYAKNGEYKKAYETLCETTVMPFICGRICPKSKQCQGKCVRGIKGEPVSIGDIESVIGDMAIENKWLLECKKQKPNGKKVAIIGSGPAGITASLYLAKAGWDVTVFEKHKKIGGILRYGIPEFRLDKVYIDALEEQMKYLGINIITEKECNAIDIKNNYNAVLICCGANASIQMRIPGEEMSNVYGANELLEYGNHPEYNGKTVIVVGGGNVAMDASRTIKKLGAKEVFVVYRRDRDQMPAEKKEVEEAEKEGIRFLFKTNIKSIKGTNVELIKTELIKREGDNRLSPKEIDGSEYFFQADYVISAIGSKLDSQYTKGLQTNEKGFISIDNNYKTDIINVFAAGDCTGEKATVAWACRAGRNAAEAINKED